MPRTGDGSNRYTRPIFIETALDFSGERWSQHALSCSDYCMHIFNQYQKRVSISSCQLFVGLGCGLSLHSIFISEYCHVDKSGLDKYDM